MFLYFLSIIFVQFDMSTVGALRNTILRVKYLLVAENILLNTIITKTAFSLDNFDEI